MEHSISLSRDSFSAYIDVLKLVLSASSFKIERIFYWANYLFYVFAKYSKPFENKAQIDEAVELHDKIYEIIAESIYSLDDLQPYE